MQSARVRSQEPTGTGLFATMHEGGLPPPARLHDETTDATRKRQAGRHRAPRRRASHGGRATVGGKPPPKSLMHHLFDLRPLYSVIVALLPLLRRLRPATCPHSAPRCYSLPGSRSASVPACGTHARTRPFLLAYPSLHRPRRPAPPTCRSQHALLPAVSSLLAASLVRKVYLSTMSRSRAHPRSDL